MLLNERFQMLVFVPPPQVAPLWPKSGQMWSSSTPNLAKLDAPVPILVDSVSILAESGEILVELSRFRPMLIDSKAFLLTLGEYWPKLAEPRLPCWSMPSNFWPKSGDFDPTSVDLGPNLAESRPNWALLAEVVGTLGPNPVGFGLCRPNSTWILPNLGGFERMWADLGQQWFVHSTRSGSTEQRSVGIPLEGLADPARA